jgi:putative lipoprotein
MRALVLAFAIRAHGHGDRWFGPDKVKHFFLSAFVQSVSYSALRTAQVEPDRALVASSAVTLAIGLGKEVRDAHVGEPFSVRDLTWDVAGAAAAGALLHRTR